MPSSPVSRWIDLMAALLARRYPLTFAKLAREVPAYQTDGSVETGTPSTAVKRMFERDKKALKEFGIPLIVHGDPGGQDAAYSLSPKDFYLPYLALVQAGRPASVPRRVNRHGFRALSNINFDPDQLDAIIDATHRIHQLGDTMLAADAESAIRKLAFDLPLDAMSPKSLGKSNTRLVHGEDQALPTILATLNDALLRRKWVSFDYYSMQRNAAAHRSAEPYGLFFLNGHWYLAARDMEKNALRTFRVNRINTVTINRSKQDTPDYHIPPTFDLRQFASSKLAWELGDGEAYEAIVEFTGESGAIIAGAALGQSVINQPQQRRFTVRRTESFARWILSFAGDAVPISPPSLIDAVRVLSSKTAALYADLSPERQ